MFTILLSLLTLLPDGNCARLTADSTAIEVGACKGTAMESVITFKDMRINPLGKVSDFKFAPNVARVLLTAAPGDTALSPYYVYKVESRRCDRLSDNPSQKYPNFSSDGKKISFIRDNNLIIKRLEYNTEIAVTTDGSDSVYNGIRDRNFKEAFGIESTVVWDPTSMYVLFTKNERLYMYSIQYKWTKEVVMPQPAAYITAIEWTSDGKSFGVMYLNREQTKLNMAMVDAATFVAKNVYEYTESKFIQPICATQFNFSDAKNNFVVIRSDGKRRQLYQYSALGKQIKAITANTNADVSALYGVDMTRRRVSYQTFDGLARTESSVMIDGTKPLSEPSVTPAHLTDGSKVMRKVDDLNYYVVMPNTEGKKPLIMYVSDFESNDDDAFEQMMADKGYMVAVVKCHGTDGQGTKFMEDNYLNMFQKPANDYMLVANDIMSHYEIDANRVTIVGEGFYAGVALSAILAEGTPFTSAVAAEPVTDVRDYNYIVTERLMKKEGATSAYRLNSAVDNASKLDKKLLLLQSMGNTEYPAKYTEKLSDILVSNNIQFDMQVFFNKDQSFTKGLSNSYLITKIDNFIK